MQIISFTCSFDQIQDLFENKITYTHDAIYHSIKNYMFLPQRILKINKLTSSFVDCSITFSTEHLFLFNKQKFPYLLANLVKKLRQDHSQKTMENLSLSETYTLESKLIPGVLTKFLVYSMHTSSPKGENCNEMDNWEEFKEDFNKLYGDIFHALKINEFTFDDKARHYSVLMNIEVAYKYFERC